MNFPSDVDFIIDGTGLTESMIAASLAITGNSVLHLDKEQYYGHYMTSFRFPELLRHLSSWSSTDSSVSKSLAQHDPFIRHCYSEYFVPEVQDAISSDPQTIQMADIEPAVGPSVNASDSVSLNEKKGLLEDPSNPAIEVFDNTSSVNTPASPSYWSQNSLANKLRHMDFDILPKLIFAESPMVKAMLRADVTRYLEFRAVTRLLTLNSTSAGDTLVKVPVSRGEVFKTRLLTLSQKRMLVGFLEWCVAATASDTEDASNETSSSDTHSTEHIDYLDRPLKEYLQTCRKFDDTTCSIVITCFALATDSITLREALPRFARSLSSMNRFGPYPMLWPTYGCGELPQSFCRMCAVFGGTYCLGKSVASVSQLAAEERDPAGPEHRSLRVTLSTGEQVTASGLIMSAHHAPLVLIEPQIKRWIARAILVCDASIFPADFKRYDVTLMPFQLEDRGSAKVENDTILEPAYILELPVESSSPLQSSLVVAHLVATCNSCLDPKYLLESTINRLYSKPRDGEKIEIATNVDESKGAPKPHLLWACYFALPDLSDVELSSSIFTSLFSSVQSPEASSETDPFNSVLFVPGLNSSLVMDSVVNVAESVFTRAFAFVHRFLPGHSPVAGELADFSGEGSTTVTTFSFVSLDAHWDGQFPPRPPRNEDLVVVDTTEASLGVDETTTTQVVHQPPKTGHGDGTETTRQDSSILFDSELVTAVEPTPP